MRGSETVTVTPKAETDRLRGSSGPAAAPYDLEGCHVLPRASQESDGGYVGIEGYDVYYFGDKAAPEHTWEVTVRGAKHQVADVPRDFRKSGRRKALIFATKRVV